MKKIIYLIVMTHLIAGVAFAADRFKIGVSTALTGNAATYGADIRSSLLFANEELAGGKYSFDFQDDACTGTAAVNVAHKLVDVEKIQYVIGFACSGALLSAANIYEKAKVIVISPSASAAAISQAGDYIFRTWMSDAAAGRKLFESMAPRYKIVGVISEETDYAQGFLKSFQDGNNDSRVKVVNENFLTNDVDYKASLLRLKGKGIEALFINSQTEATFLTVLKQVRNLKIDLPIYGVYWPGSEALRDVAGSLMEGVIFVDLPFSDDVLSVDGKAVLARFKAKYGKLNFGDMLFVFSFEAFRALHQAIHSGDDIRHYLYNTKFHGILGDWWFNKDGDIQGVDFAMKMIKGGKVTKLVD